ncbi:hypothetical protein AVEN_123756-1 [Araneus ventricosus]|uniref:Uncharacterized protein n=1 Tax=Araneus ventricosus TaxID=182803 RepID=A0A4Y2BJX9_ARAVE|nr:hypothetical protein AVEN_123756-1 [Araneus ventricosus]
MYTGSQCGMYTGSQCGMYTGSQCGMYPILYGTDAAHHSSLPSQRKMTQNMQLLSDTSDGGPSDKHQDESGDEDQGS